MRCCRFAALCGLLAFSALAALTPAEQAAIDRISADSLRGNLSFLASDALEGRATPSRGLDIAAEFIAAEFRRAGLEPIAKDNSYFQTAKLVEVTPNPQGVKLTLKSGNNELEPGKNDLQIRARAAIDLERTPVFELPESGALPAIEGKVVAGSSRVYGSESAMIHLSAAKPSLILLVGRRRVGVDQGPSYLDERDSGSIPVIRIANAALADELAARHPLTMSLHLSASRTKDVVARNVGAILRGSDPVLRNQYVFLSAHYDHLGMSGDRIYNGANDNGSGTVSVIEIASALAKMQSHPRRSIVFMAWYGEEEGLLGAYYYAHHPIVPMKDTVANINLEQMGRTDDESGREVGKFAFTGPSYSDLPARLSAAAKQEQVGTWARKDADSFFDRSDNYAFALAGVVAHTIVVAFEYPDYHGVGDHWEKLDYANMAKVDKGVAAGLIEVANAAQPPKWTESNSTLIYRDAGK